MKKHDAVITEDHLRKDLPETTKWSPISGGQMHLTPRTYLGWGFGLVGCSHAFSS